MHCLWPLLESSCVSRRVRGVSSSTLSLGEREGGRGSAASRTTQMLRLAFKSCGAPVPINATEHSFRTAKATIRNALLRSSCSKLTRKTSNLPAIVRRRLRESTSTPTKRQPVFSSEKFPSRSSRHVDVHLPAEGRSRGCPANLDCGLV